MYELQKPHRVLGYKLYVAPEKYVDFDYSEFKAEDVSKFINESVHVADIVSFSEFVASEFGDDEIFFRHQFRAKPLTK